MTGSDDGALVAAALSGDKEAFGVLVDRYKNFVYRYFLKRVPAADCEDLTQEVFLRSWEELENYRADSPFPGWLFLLAMKVAHRFVKSTYRTPRPASGPVIEARSVHSHTERHRDEARQEAVSAVRSAIETLDDRESRLVHLVFAGGLSRTEAALALGIPRATAFRVMKEALREIRLQIEDREPRSARTRRIRRRARKQVAGRSDR